MTEKNQAERSEARKLGEARKPSVARWIGTPPADCDVCHRPLNDFEWWVDGRVQWVGKWAHMCPRCFGTIGAGLGTGSGQKYDRKTLEKLEG